MITREKFNQLASCLEGMKYYEWESFKRHIDEVFRGKRCGLESSLRIESAEELETPFMMTLKE